MEGGRPMNARTLFNGQSTGLFTTALLCLVGSGAAWADTYDPVTRQLTIPTVIIGATSYSDMVVTVGSVVSGPSGTTPRGSVDAYDTASGHLTIPTVTVGTTTYHNVVVAVASLVSIGGINGSDSYDGSHLTIRYVQVGGIVYFNVIITVGSIVSHGGGMPANALDVFDPSSRQLTIASILYAGKVRTNAVITLGTLTSVGGLSPAVTLTASHLSFNCVQYCSPQTLSLFNTAATTLAISSIVASGPKAGTNPAFNESNNCPASLGTGESCAITVTYAGVAYATDQGSLIVTDNGAGSPQTVPLQGYIY
jgi:hypothetical protein